MGDERIMDDGGDECECPDASREVRLNHVMVYNGFTMVYNDLHHSSSSSPGSWD